MRRKSITVFLGVTMILATALSAGAASFKFRISEFSAGSLVFSGVAVGLGNGDYTFNLEGTATVTAHCQNQGGTLAQGRNDLSVSVTATDTESGDSNGQTSIVLAVDVELASFGDAPPSKKDAGCPNGNWSVVDVEVAEWTAAHVWVTDQTGTVVFDQLYECSGVDESLTCTAV